MLPRKNIRESFELRGDQHQLTGSMRYLIHLLVSLLNAICELNYIKASHTTNDADEEWCLQQYPLDLS